MSGVPPIQAAGLAELMVATLLHPPAPLRELRPETPPILEAIVLRCLAKDPRQRYPDAAALRDELADFLAGRASLAATRGGGLRRARAAALTGVLALALSLVAADRWRRSAEPPGPGARPPQSPTASRGEPEYAAALAARRRGEGAEFLRLLQDSAAAGPPAAMALLGELSLRSEGGAPARAEGARWLARAAEAGHPEAAQTLTRTLIDDPALRGAWDGAWRWLQGAAERDDPRALCVLGFDALARSSGPQDDAEAASYFSRAARLGWAEGQSNLGGLHLLGRGVLRDPREGERLLLAAAEQDHGLAQAMLGEHLLRSESAARRAEAARWARRSAEQGRPQGQSLWGRMLCSGQGVARDPEAALPWLERAAQAGDVPAMLWLGKALAQLLPPERIDLAAALRWLRTAAEAGDAEAAHDASLLLGANSTSEAERAEHRRLLRQSAQGGYPPAQGLLGVALIEDEPGSEEGLSWLRRAAEGGNAEALGNLGTLYLLGTGVERDPPRGLELLDRAAAAGDPQAMGNLAYAYAKGLGVPVDPERALAWHERAAAAGRVDSMLEVARGCFEGRRGAPDPQRGLAWLQRAADLGHPGACFDLARALEQGLAGDPDLASARALYERARAAGDPGLAARAREALARLGPDPLEEPEPSPAPR